jgi:hypothetical protein
VPNFFKSLYSNILNHRIIDAAWEDYLFWQKNDKQKLNKINELLKDISRSPFEGIGKQETLKFKFLNAGFIKIKYKILNHQKN